MIRKSPFERPETVTVRLETVQNDSCTGCLSQTASKLMFFGVLIAVLMRVGARPGQKVSVVTIRLGIVQNNSWPDHLSQKSFKKKSRQF